MFDAVRLRVFTKTKSIEACEHINVTFYSNYNTWSEAKLEYLLSVLFEIYGPDDNGKGLLVQDDLMDLQFNIFSRSWTLGTDDNVHGIQLTKKEKEGLEFHIIFLKNFLRSLGKL